MDTTTTSVTAKFQQKYSLQTIHQISPSFAALHAARLRRLHLSQIDEEKSAPEPSTSTLLARSPWEQIPLQCTHCGHLGAITTRLVRIRNRRTTQTRSSAQSKSSGESEKEGQRNHGRRCIRRSCGICGRVDDEMICSENDRRLDFPSTRSMSYNAAVKTAATTAAIYPAPQQSRVDLAAETFPTPRPQKKNNNQTLQIPNPESSTTSYPVAKPSQPSTSREASDRKKSKGKKSGLQEMLQRAREKKAAENGKLGGGLVDFLGGL